ncbi:EamA family transporter [Rubrivirga sp. S365]|uniref:EamA family transporter n=1 Tax=Rubrivirga litoralis TaxID=3075598 RepID=A0ABU3BQS7_9BACT|nr:MULTISPECIES: EamA family transporter [unclassified Rubrivirga]MDT0631638.1 EamA family transporter [Rubrivirga sp. F394]MDT7855619.1 EamA family transporter [Rubrivirga sp. S365]
MPPTPRPGRPLSRPALAVLVALVMAAFAANSVLARLALRTTAIDAATFSAVRLAAGGAVLALVARRGGSWGRGGSWPSALALFVYAAAFSFAYLALSAGAGALVLFGAVQLTMIGWGLAHGERLSAAQSAGLALAVGGLVLLLAPGVTAPPAVPALLMAAAGAAWGAYSLRGRGAVRPAAESAGNFLRASLLGATLLTVAAAGGAVRLDGAGLAYAALSGGVTSGLGYAAWYAVLPALRTTTAATVQLSVPVLAALGGAALVGEPVTLRLAAASAVTLGGVAVVVRGGGGRRARPQT